MCTENDLTFLLFTESCVCKSTQELLLSLLVLLCHSTWNSACLQRKTQGNKRIWLLHMLAYQGSLFALSRRTYLFLWLRGDVLWTSIKFAEQRVLLHLPLNRQHFLRGKQEVKGSPSLTERVTASCLGVPQLPLYTQLRSKDENLCTPRHRLLCFRSSKLFVLSTNPCKGK